jgi:hypothetical protein
VSLAVLALTPSARAATLYAVGGNTQPSGGQSALYTVDKATGQLTWVGSLGTPFNYDNSIYNGGVAYDPYTDRMYALGCDSSVTSALFLVNRTTAQITRIGYLGGTNPYSFCSGGLTFDTSTHKLYAVGDVGAPIQSSALVEIDPATGAMTVIGGTGAAFSGTGMSGLGFDASTGTLYANGYTSFDLHSALFAVDRGTGFATMIGYHGLSLGRQMDYSGLAVDPATNVMYGFGSVSASASGLFALNRTTGAATLVALQSPGIGVDGALVFAGPDVLGAPAPSPATAAVALRSVPSPARGPVSITFTLAYAAFVSLSVHDVAGRRLATLADSRLEAGAHEARWDGLDALGQRVPAGVYFATLRAGGRVLGRTTVLIER